MDGAHVEGKASLQGCIVGRRAVIGHGSKLDGSEVQDGYRIEAGTVGSKGDKFATFEGLENGLDGAGDDQSGNEVEDA